MVDKAPFEKTDDGKASGLSHRAKWKILSLLPLITTIPLLFIAFVIPESYIFLLKIRKYNKAADSAIKYGLSTIHGLKNLLECHFEMASETPEKKTTKKSARRKATKNKEKGKEEEEEGSISDAGLQNSQGSTKDLDRRQGDVWDRIRDAKTANAAIFKRRENSCPHHYQMRQRSFFKRLWKLLSDPSCRRACYSCVLVMVAQSSCSINAYAFFTSPLVDNGIKEGGATWFGVSFGATNFFFGLLTLALTDRHGRTTLLLCGLPFLTILAFVLGGVFNIQDRDTRTGAVWVVCRPPCFHFLRLTSFRLRSLSLLSMPSLWGLLHLVWQESRSPHLSVRSGWRSVFLLICLR